MRLLSLRFKNLNSLVGEWNIDFTAPAYEVQGLFAITGPTGAGKSTLLDAICLALYGSTPRLGRITVSQNDIMSRHTGECFAEVCFETLEGQFRVHWAQHRARRQAQGALQSPRHEIAQARCGTVLAHQTTRTMAEVERITGLDFERFTRSVLLAQGNFAAFLQADANQRAPILEQITGTEIYSDISMQVHGRYRQEHIKLQELKQALEHIELLPEAQEQQLQTDLNQIEVNLQQLTTQLQRYRQIQQHHTELQQAQKQLTETQEALESWERTRLQFAPQAQQLVWAEKAVRLETAYYQLSTQRDELKLMTQQLQQHTERRPVLQTQLQASKTELEQAQTDQQQQHQNWLQQRPVLQQVRQLDQERLLLKKTQQQTQKTLATKQAQRQQEEQQLTQNQTRLIEVQTALTRCSHYLQQHQNDAGLVAQWAVLQQQHQFLQESEQEQFGKEQDQHRLALHLEQLNEQTHKQELSLAAQKERLERLQQQINSQQTQLDQVSNAKPLRYWHNYLQQLNEDCRLAEANFEFHQASAELEQEQQQLQVQIQQLHQAERQQQYQLEQARQHSQQWHNQAETLGQLLLTEQKVLDLEQERTRLQAQQPCPLCGSIEHPYATQELTINISATQAQTEQAQTQLKLHQRQVDHLMLGEARLQEQIRACQQRLIQLTEQRQQRVQQFAHRFSVPEAELEWSASKQAAAQKLWQQKLHQVQQLREQLAQIEQTEQSLAKSQKDYEQVHQALLKDEQSWRKTQQDLQLKQQSQTSLEADLTQRAHRIATLRKQLVQQCQNYVKTFATDTVSLAVVLEDLSERSKAWQQQQELQQGWLREQEQLTHTLAQIQSKQLQLQEEIQQYSTELEQLAQKQQFLSSKRYELLGDRNPDQIEQLLEQNHQRSVDHCRLTELQHQKQVHELQSLDQALLQQQKQHSQLQTQLQQLELDFKKKLTQQQFISEDSFLQAQLDHEQISQLQQQKEQIEHTMRVLRAKTSDCLQQVQQLNLKIEAFAEPDWEPKLQLTEQQQSELLQQQGQISVLLNQNESKKSQAQKQLQAIALQNNELNKWAQLHDLIGSADGKKFRNFAQGLTFERMIQQANLQLSQMQDRYLLLHDATEPLNLNVIDNYQAGEVRSTKNLSGGESFIISLALALGLSQMASQNVRLDSLFLDEGFGTLDEEALEVALQTLVSLQQSGKLIGVISHIPALKERIATQLQVLPLQGGRSRLIGPGVTGN